MCKAEPPKKTKIQIHFEGKALDVTDWTRAHPGGSKILKIFNERDCSAQVYATHSKEALTMIRSRANRSKRRVAKPVAGDQEYIDLYNKYEKLGYFQVDKWVIFENIWKNLAVFVPFIYGFYLVFQGTSPWTSVLLVGWAMYYAGWVGHDYSHHQYAPSSNCADAYFCDFMACVHGSLRGNGGLWWKRRHNTHHVVTNEVGNDPDIKTNPLLVFSDHFNTSWFNKYQHLYFVPLLSLLDFYWHVESWQVDFKVAFGNRKGGNKREKVLARRDIVGLLIWDFLFLYWGMTAGFFYPFICLWWSGACTAIVVFTTHYAEERLDPNPDMSFVEQTCRTSRNIIGFFGEDLVWSYLTNNLSLQKEHHLFPRMSNTYLRCMRNEVKQLVSKHGWEYTEDNIIQCVYNAMDLLQKTAC